MAPAAVSPLCGGPEKRPLDAPTVSAICHQAGATRAGDGDMLQGQILPARMWGQQKTLQRGSCPLGKGGQSKAVHRETEGTRRQKKVPGPFSTSPAQTLPHGISCITSATRDATRFVPRPALLTLHCF